MFKVGCALGELKQYNDNRENLDLLVELTRKLNDKTHFIRAQTAEMFEQQQSLALAESRLIMLLDMTPLGMMITLNRVISYANKRMEDITGYKKSELIGRSTRILYESDDEWVQMGNIQHINPDTKTPTRLKRKDGQKSECVVRMTRITEMSVGSGEEFVVTVYLEKEVDSSGC
jgi:PAS domain S-box-containing protein